MAAKKAKRKKSTTRKRKLSKRRPAKSRSARTTEKDVVDQKTKVRLSSVQILNYRSCIDTTFEPKANLSVLIGPNGSGKTNILLALALLRSLSGEEMRRYGVGNAVYGEEPTSECRLRVSFDVDKKKVQFTADIKIYTDDRNNDAVVSSEESWNLFEFTGSRKKYRFPLRALIGDPRMLRDPRALRLRFLRPLPRKGMQRYRRMMESIVDLPKRAVEALHDIATFLSKVTYYSASQFTNPSTCPISLEVDKLARRPIPSWDQMHSGPGEQFLRDLDQASRSNGGARYREFVEIIGPRGIHLVDHFSLKEQPVSSRNIKVKVGGRLRETTSEKLLVIPQFKIGKNVLSPNQLSEGTYRTIALVFYLLTSRATLLLIEEPEVCVHHGLLSSVLELTANSSHERQIILTTHSDYVLDHVEPSSVYSVRRSSEGHTKVRNVAESMSKRDFEALKEYLDHEGSLGEYWKHGALV